MQVPESGDRTILRATVKLVQSADTLTLRGVARGGPPPERVLSLANITAPRLARPAGKSGAATEDEPFAWEAREFLRELTIGKELRFRVDYKVSTGREFGSVWTNDNNNVAALLVARGLARVKVQQGDRDRSPDYEELVRLETVALAQKLGVHADDATKHKHVRSVKWTVEKEKLRQFIDQHKFRPIDAIVEHVRDAGSYRVILLPSFTIANVSLTGVKAATFRRTDDGKEVPEPYAEEGRYFAETQVLQRAVKVVLEGEANNGFLGTILLPHASLTELVLAEGFAKCVDWSISMVTQGIEKLRVAEKTAKAKQARLWKGYVAPQQNLAIKERTFTAKVVEIVSPEQLTVRLGSGELLKIQLSSIRQPRLETAKEGQEEGAAAAAKPSTKQQQLFEVPYLFEAREFLRTKYHNKKVRVDVDFIRPAQGNFPEKICATVWLNDVNIAESLVSKGLATVLRHRADDENRSAKYDDLLVAESRAQKAQKGVFSKSPPTHHVNDLSAGPVEKSRQFLPFLTKTKRNDAVVEFVSSGSRFKLYLPKETCLLSFILSGVSVPRSGRQGEAGEPFGNEATEFMRNLSLQHNVEAEFDSIDKNGGFVGSLFLDGTNLAVSLVEAGLARVHGSADYGSYGRPLYAAEEQAKKKRLNIWKDYVEVDHQAEQLLAKEAEESVERVENRVPVVITFVESPNKIFVQQAADIPQLDAVMGALSDYLTNSPPLAGAYTPRKNELCAARYSVDGGWYRAKVVALSPLTVFYIDFGNTETVTPADLAALPIELQKLPAQATEVSLVGITTPSDVEYAKDAQMFLDDLLVNKTLMMNVESTRDRSLVTLVDGITHHDTGLALLNAGLAIADNRRERHLAKLVAAYKAAQERAKVNRYGIWEYGDVTGDDAKEFGVQPRK